MLAEQNQNLQRVQENSNFNISELEKHNRTLKEVSHSGRSVSKYRYKGQDTVLMCGWLTVSQSLKQQQEAELQTSQQLHREKKELQEKVANLQSFLQKLQSERAEIEEVVTRFGKDKSALRKALEKVSWLACCTVLSNTDYTYQLSPRNSESSVRFCVAVVSVCKNKTWNN